MLGQINHSSIEWKIKQSSLSDSEQLEWQNLILNNTNLTAASFINFNLNGIQLLSNNAPIFVLGYINEAENYALKVAFVLVRKKKSISGISFSLLQPVSHDHLDMINIVGDDFLLNTNHISSLIKALNENIDSWNLLSARRLRLSFPICNKLISPSYSRKAAYFNLLDSQGNRLPLKELIPKKLFKNISRFERKIETELRIKLDFISCVKPDEIKLGLTEFFNLEASGWKGKAGSAIQCEQKLVNFYRNSWADFARHNLARIFLLEAEDKVIASGIAIKTNNELILHKIAFDESLSKYGPGSILIKCIMQYAVEDEDTKSICFNTNPPWLKRWHPRLYNLVALQIFNNSLKGRLISLIFYGIDTLRKIKQKLKIK